MNNSDLKDEIMKGVSQNPSAIFLISKATGMPLSEILSNTNKMPATHYRQLLTWYLWYEGVPMDGITEVTGRIREVVRHHVNKIHNYISMGDKETIRIIKNINTSKSIYNSR